MWLQDFLPKDFKNVRIMSYGYNSSLDSDANNGLLDFRRHLVQQLENARNFDEVCELPLEDSRKLGTEFTEGKKPPHNICWAQPRWDLDIAGAIQICCCLG
jgi:hypothetical protein